MIDRNLLGRYEYVNPAENSNKYWCIAFDRNLQTYVAGWGRIGSKGQYITYPEEVALKKIKEKMRKGYKKVQSDFDDIIGENSIDWIKRVCE